MAIAANDVENALGDGGEDPFDDAGINPAPLVIAFLGRGGGTNVALETEFAEGGIEEVAPLAMVGFVHVEDDRDVVADGDALDRRGGGGGDGEVVIQEESEWWEEGAIGAAEGEVAKGCAERTVDYDTM